ncbi:VOC family protein [Streptomyces sp. NPDC007851]|uniref:VOC family protein n=1 Tax=Streptomyces sp. NPDC007851 TaxID=3155008 RepID=UPI0033E0AFC5
MAGGSFLRSTGDSPDHALRGPEKIGACAFLRADQRPHRRRRGPGAACRVDRMHFDVSTPDPAAERQRVEALGGRRLEQYADDGFLLMADPEGNEFCVIPEGPFEPDDEGRADHLG